MLQSKLRCDYYSDRSLKPVYALPNANVTYGVDGTRKKGNISLRECHTKSLKASPNIDDVFDERITRKLFSDNGLLPYKVSSSVNKFSQDKRRFIDAKQENLPRKPLPDSKYIGMNHEGIATRNVKQKNYDYENNRFHFTYTNYQHAHFGSYPLPIDTRKNNKKVLNY